MTIKSTTEPRRTTPTRHSEDAFTQAAPAKRAEVQPSLDRRAQRNLTNLGGGSNFSSSNLKPVGVASKQSTGAMTPALEQRGFDAIGTIREVQEGVETRTAALESANEAVKASETALAEHLAHLQHALTPEELQAYADDFRSDEPAYAQAEAAAQELATYVADNTARLADAESDVAKYHPQPEVYGEVLQGARRTAAVFESAAAELEEHVALSLTGSPELQETLGRIDVGTVVSRLEDVAGLAESIPRFAALAERAGAAFGIIGAVADGKTFLDGVLKDGNPEDYAGLAASGVLVAQGVLTIAGVAVSAPVSMVAGAVSLVASGVSDWRDNEERVADMTERLVELDIAPAETAETIARANPAAFEALADAGYSAEQLRRITSLGATTLMSAHAEEARTFAAAVRTLGLSPEDAVRMLEAAGPGLASRTAVYLNNARAGSNGTAEDLLRALRVPYPDTERQREVIFAALG